MCGLPVVYQDICTVRSPLLQDIAAEGFDNFCQYMALLTSPRPLELEDKELIQMIEKMSDFEYLLLFASASPQNKQKLNAAFYFFTGESIITLPPPIDYIIIGDPNEKRFLTKTNFPGFQELVSNACALVDAGDTIEFLESDSPMVRQLKEKLLAGRRDRMKAKRSSSSKDKELNFSDLVGSLTIGSNSYNLENVWRISYYAFQDQFKRMGWKEEFSINTRASLMGAKLNKDKLAYWIKTMSFK